MGDAVGVGVAVTTIVQYFWCSVHPSNFQNKVINTHTLRLE